MHCVFRDVCSVNTISCFTDRLTKDLFFFKLFLFFLLCRSWECQVETLRTGLQHQHQPPQVAPLLLLPTSPPALVPTLHRVFIAGRNCTVVKPVVIQQRNPLIFIHLYNFQLAVCSCCSWVMGIQELVSSESCTFPCCTWDPQSQPKHRHGRKWRRRRW